jgi:hypothetical protein
LLCLHRRAVPTLAGDDLEIRRVRIAGHTESNIAHQDGLQHAMLLD